MSSRRSNACVTGRDKDYIDLNIRFTIDVIKAANVIRMFPDLLKGYALTAEYLSVTNIYYPTQARG